MIKITALKPDTGKKIQFQFSDGAEKTIGFEPFIGNDSLSIPFSDPVFFRKVELIENGRGIYWPNDFDFCPDFLYEYQSDEKSIPKEED